jgi:hypothetical protein
MIPNEHGPYCICRLCDPPSTHMVVYQAADYSKSRYYKDLSARGKHILERVYGKPFPAVRVMTAADLGIVDELLDDKVGMELGIPPRVTDCIPPVRLGVFPRRNPLDGARLWDNS